MSDILLDIEWAIDTISSRLMFGMGYAPLQAAYSRERRAKGVLMCCKREIKKLREENKRLNDLLDVVSQE